jgi:hypothetical protein
MLIMQNALRFFSLPPDTPVLERPKSTLTNHAYSTNITLKNPYDKSRLTLFEFSFCFNHSS